ncbi:MAG TPA: hypothetical protein VE974_11065 [Thermoanaerobaculia bacterium]|nr:hypothetical protein [Thermoanaerobaculia bacterium]
MRQLLYARPALRGGEVLADVDPVEAVVGEVAVAVEVEVGEPVTPLLALFSSPRFRINGA